MTWAPDILASRYRLVALIGRGGVSDVYRAVDERSGQTVAVKVVRSGDEAQARRLAREADTLRGLDHPNLVRFLAAGTLDAQAYLVMSFVEGSTLAELLSGGPLSPETTTHLAQGVAGGLAYIHSRGVVHRDIKPANVLVTDDGQVRLADFGIARVTDASTLTLDGTTVGTVAYMAPEQLQHHVVGPEADVWSLGAILLECLTGERLFSGPAAEVIARRLRQESVVVPSSVPTRWARLLESMLDPEPGRRPSAAELVRRLDVDAPPAGNPWGAPATVGAATTVLDLPDRTAVYSAAQALEAAPAADGHVHGRSPGPGARPRRRRHRLAVATGSAAVGVGAALALAFGIGRGHAAPSTSTTLAPTTVTTVATTLAPTTVAPPPTTPPPPPPKHHHGNNGPAPGPGGNADGGGSG